MILQQRGRGTYVAVRPDSPKAVGAADVQPGDEVLVEGTASSGGFAPIISPTAVHKIAFRGIPEPLMIADMAQLNEERIENVMGRIRAHVVSADQGFFNDGKGYTLLRLQQRGVTLTNLVLGTTAAQVETWIGSEIETTGVLGTQGNGRRQRAHTVIYSSSADMVRIVEPAHTDWDSRNIRPINTLLTWGSGTFVGNLVHVAGQVTWVSKKLLYVQQGDAGIPVVPAIAGTYAVGDFVEVQGKLTKTEDEGYTISEALLRRARVPGVEVKPVDGDGDEELGAA